jgi:hypothetical protein
MKISLFSLLVLTALTASASPYDGNDTNNINDYNHAQRLAFSSPQLPTVTRAIDLVEHTGTKRVTVGNSLVFARQQKTAARKIVESNFQVRIFALLPGQSRPAPGTEGFDHCQIYYSSVYPVRGTGQLEITVAQPDERWLNVSADASQVSNGHYLLIFERSSSSDSIFRIHEDDAKNYFANGIELVVEDDKRSSLVVVANALQARITRRQALVAQLTLNNPGIPCFRYQPLRVASVDHLVDVEETTLGFCAAAPAESVENKS